MTNKPHTPPQPDIEALDLQSLLNVVRKIDYDGHAVCGKDFAHSFDDLRLFFTTDELSSGKVSEQRCSAFEAVGEKPDFEKLAITLSRKFFAKDLIKSDLKLIEFALQSAHEAGVAQGRKAEREYIAKALKSDALLKQSSGELLYMHVINACEEIVRKLPPQGDKK